MRVWRSWGVVWFTVLVCLTPAARAEDLRLPILPVTGQEVAQNWTKYIVSSRDLDGARKTVTVWLLVKSADAREVVFQLVEVPGYQEDWKIPNPMPEGSRLFDVPVGVGEALPYVQVHDGAVLRRRYDRTAEADLRDGGTVSWRNQSFEYAREEDGRPVTYRINTWSNRQYAFGGLAKIEVLRTLADGRYSVELWEHDGQAPTPIVAEPAEPAEAAEPVAEPAEPAAAVAVVRTPHPLPGVTGRETVGQWVKYRTHLRVFGHESTLAKWLIVTAVSADAVTFRDVVIPWIDAADPAAIPDPLPGNSQDRVQVVAIGEALDLTPQVPHSQVMRGELSTGTVLLAGRVVPCRVAPYTYARDGQPDGRYVYYLADDIPFSQMARYTMKGAVELEITWVAQSTPFPARDGAPYATLTGKAPDFAAVVPETAAPPPPAAPPVVVTPPPPARPPEPAEPPAALVALPPPAAARPAVIRLLDLALADLDRFAEVKTTASLKREQVVSRLVPVVAGFANAHELLYVIERGAPTAGPERDSLLSSAINGAEKAGRLDLLNDLIQLQKAKAHAVNYGLYHQESVSGITPGQIRVLAQLLRQESRDAHAFYHQLDDLGRLAIYLDDGDSATWLYRLCRDASPNDTPAAFVGAYMAYAARTGQDALAREALDQLVAALGTVYEFNRDEIADGISAGLLGMPRDHAVVAAGIAALDASLVGEAPAPEIAAARILLAARLGDLDSIRRLLPHAPQATADFAFAQQAIDHIEARPQLTEQLAALVPRATDSGVILEAGICKRQPAGSTPARQRLQALEPIATQLDAASDQPLRRSAFSPIVDAYLALGFLDDAERAARAATDSLDRSRLLRDVLDAAILRGDIPRAVRLTDRERGVETAMFMENVVAEKMVPLMSPAQALQRVADCAPLFVAGRTDGFRNIVLKAYLAADRPADAQQIFRTLSAKDLEDPGFADLMVWSHLTGRSGSMNDGVDFMLRYYGPRPQREPPDRIPRGGSEADVWRAIAGNMPPLALSERWSPTIPDSSSHIVALFAGAGAEGPLATVQAKVAQIPDPEVRIYAYLGLARSQAK